MVYKNRTHYRNTLMHIGHLQTIFYNNDQARLHKGICCVIIDDRQKPDRVEEIKQNFDYLNARNTEIISVRQHLPAILDYTKELINKKHLYVATLTEIEKQPKRIIQLIDKPSEHYQLRLFYDNKHPTIGYTKEIDGEIILILLFDYIIKVLDHILQINHIITTTQSDITDPQISDFFDNILHIQYDVLPTYHIDGFRYSKRDWPALDESDPRLLTLQGLRARHVPATVLYAFYLHAMQVRDVKIGYLDTLLRSYLNHVCGRVFGIVNPVKVHITNWPEATTEFVCKPCYPPFTDRGEPSQYLSPLSREVYIDRYDFGFENDSNLSKNREVRLKYGPVITCTDVSIKDGIQDIQVYYSQTSSKPRKCIHWVSSSWGEEPIKVRYYLYNWFYTGMNSLLPLAVKEGFIEPEPFNHLEETFQLERTGYFAYDEILSRKDRMPCFVRICGIKNYPTD